MSGHRVARTAAGSIALVVASLSAWLLLDPIQDTGTRVFWTAASMLVLLLIFDRFLPGALVLLLIAMTVTIAWTVSTGFESMWQIGTMLIFGSTLAGGAVVLLLIFMVRNTRHVERHLPLPLPE